MTEPELQELCAEWQKILRLQDWEIHVCIARSRDMPEGMQGCIDMVWPRKEAHISIIDPVDYPPDSWWAQDMERTLVHELLHLHSPERENEREDIQVLIEQGVQLTACALVDLKRQR
jgi:hypothetical protein